MARTKITADETASQLAKIALRVLKRFSLADEENRIRAAERRIKTSPAKPPNTRLT